MRTTPTLLLAIMVSLPGCNAVLGLDELDRAPVDAELADTTDDVALQDSYVEPADSGSDATAPDTTVTDSASPDTFVADTFVADTFVADTFVADTFVADTFVADTFVADTFVGDAGLVDTGAVDTGVVDTGVVDTGVVDTGDTGFDAGCGSLTPCAGKCVDTATDRASCGACGHLCPSGQTCVSGVCSDGATHSSLTDPTKWSAFSILGVANVAGWGAVFDGRHLYIVPCCGPAAWDHTVARYDTTAPLTTSSWSAFDLSPVNTAARSFNGGAFDGRYVYFVPADTTNHLVTRYDTLAAFSSPSSWKTFDPTTVDANAKGFAGATFDGRYLYLVPNNNGAPHGNVTRYDTKSEFAAASSWMVFDVAKVSSAAKGFMGASFDGRYLYLVPIDNGSRHGNVARYDTTNAFTSAESWAVFDVATVNPSAKGYVGAAYDGRYVYLVPHHNGAYHGIIARYDTKLPFGSSTSWVTFDIASVDSRVNGLITGAFDGRYLYLVPSINNAGANGVLARYDTSAPLTTASSWTIFDISTVNASSKAHRGSAFDGRYIYFIPGGWGMLSRFDARTPAGPGMGSTF